MINETNLSSVPPAKDLGIEFISELNKLSIRERDEVTYDVHGVKDILNEDPTFIRDSIKSCEFELRAIPQDNKKAYLYALDQNPDYVMNEKVLLMFLRAVQFNTKAAASRFVAYFQMKLELFGRDKLGRDIRVDDLNEDDIGCLESGYAQVLNLRDRADRAVFVLMPMIRKFKTIENKLRAIYMVLMFALKDTDTQKNGVVAIAYNVGSGKTKDRQAVFKNAQLVSALPLRFTGVHYCYDDEKLRGLFYVAMYIFQKAARVRCRFHLGTDMEIIYTLMTFGIPNEALPVSSNGSLRLEGHRDYIRKMRKSDELFDDINRVIVPGKYDVLLGRGKPLQKFSGNLNYHYVIEGYHDRYEAAAKGQKAGIAMEIVKKIHSLGGRFLKQNEAGWAAITDEAAKTKVSHTFRNHRIAALAALKKATAISICKDTGAAMLSRSLENRRVFALSESMKLRNQGSAEHKKRKLKDDSRVGDRTYV
mmetsp:Transcript_8514/g.17761  ORF Transcript_8514/g.17761 Transcript_8514/m.17761 type:complete len:477 (-) Transcript_8514:73-1503(-)